MGGHFHYASATGEHRAALSMVYFSGLLSKRGWRRRLLYSVCVVPKGWSCSTEKRIVQADGAPQASIHCWRTTIHHLKRVSPDAGVSF